MKHELKSIIFLGIPQYKPNGVPGQLKVINQIFASAANLYNQTRKASAQTEERLETLTHEEDGEESIQSNPRNIRSIFSRILGKRRIRRE
jgi:hypothetical protein